MKPVPMPDSNIKAHGKVSAVESASIIALHHGRVLVRLDDDKPRAMFIITTPKALAALAKAASAAVKADNAERRRQTRHAKTILVQRPPL